MTKRGARVGAAAVALGLSLAAPQAVGVAAADAVDQDAAGPAKADAQAPAAKSRAERAAPTVGPASEHPAARPAAATAGGGPGDSPPPASPAGAARPGKHRLDRVDPAPAAGTVATGPTVPTVPTAPAGPALPGPGAGATAVGGPAGPAALKPASAGAAANAVAMAGAAVSRFFDSAATWLSQFPRNPVTDVLQGALVLIRRSLLGLIAATWTAVAGSQTAATSPYLGEEELRGYLLGLALQQYGSLFGQTVPQYDYGYRWLNGTLVPVSTSGDRGGPTSDTNTQVDGVDEVDFVETDGNYVYVARNGALTILGADSATVSQTALSGFVVGQFLAGDRLTVITQSGGGWYGPAVRMAYGPWWDWNPQTTVTVFDVSDRSAPTITGQTVFDGSYRDARAVDGVVFVVLDRTLSLPQPLYTEVASEVVSAQKPAPVAGDGWYGPTVIGYRTYETWDAYLARVGDQITTLALPHAYSVEADGTMVDLGVIAGGGEIVRPGSSDEQALVTVVSIDSADTTGGFASGVASLVASSGATVYMTPDALYLATAKDEYSDIGSSTSTRIDRFGITGTEVGWQATGVVPGTLINQFAMDEYGGHLRVATHTWSSQWAGGTWATVNDSGVYVLDTGGDTLDMVGSVTGLAPGEQLYAVRFLGDTAYLVTFLRTDPLFAIDLSDPAAPAVQGELVIPGFSNYLQSVGDGLLLGIGQERDPGSWDARMHVSLFDVSDGGNLTLIERQFLDEVSQWSSSDAQFDHHALLYSAEDGLLVVPLAAGGYDLQTGDYTYRQTLQVLRVGADGIAVIGEIDTDSAVLRTVRIGDVLYAVSDDHVTAYSLTDLSEIGRTPLSSDQQPVPLPA